MVMKVAEKVGFLFEVRSNQIAKNKKRITKPYVIRIKVLD